jgi:DNA repair exonuclease SbcCD ATPase subunit
VAGGATITDESERLRSEYDGLRQLKPRVRDNFEALSTELSESQTKILDFENSLGDISRRLASLNEVIKQLNTDLEIVNSDIRNNEDAARLQKFGSETIGGDISAEICPTCKQRIQDNLLTADASGGFMSIENNIRHLKEQKKMLDFSLGSRRDSRDKLQREKEDMASRLQTLRRLAQTIRSDLYTTTDTEASEAIMLKRIEITNRLERLSKLQDTIVATTDRLKELSGEWNTYLVQKGNLPSRTLSDSDTEKIKLLKNKFIMNLKEVPL